MRKLLTGLVGTAALAVGLSTLTPSAEAAAPTAGCVGCFAAMDMTGQLIFHCYPVSTGQMGGQACLITPPPGATCQVAPPFCIG